MQTTLQLQVDNELLFYTQKYAKVGKKTVNDVLYEHMLSIASEMKLKEEIVKRLPRLKKKSHFTL